MSQPSEETTSSPPVLMYTRLAPIDPKTDPARVRLWRQHEIIFELLICSVPRRIDAWINVASQ